MIDVIKYILPELFIVLFTVSYLTISVLSNGKALVAYSNNISAIFLLLASAIVFTQDTSSDPVMNGFYSSNAFTSFFKGLILILSAIQGISEFLPISSSAHLIIVSSLFDLKTNSLLIDISLHLGSLLAIVFFFRKEDIHSPERVFF